MNPQGQAAIVTGGGSGLGAATAIRLAARGARVALLDVNLDAAKAVAAACGGLAIACDVGEADAMAAALAQARAAHGPARMLVNCAGIGPAAYEGQIGQAAYAASKGGVLALVLPAARELAQFGIRVNAIAPGIFATPMLTGMPEEVQQSLGASVPFPKRLGRPEQYADLVLHIVENRYINGETIRLDGALRMAPR